MTDISVIIVNFNTKDITKDCLRSLLSVSNEAVLQIFVVDNNSSDDSMQAIREEFSAEIANRKIELIQNSANLGFARANNKPKEKCLGEYILFLNSDTIVKPGAIKQTLEYMRSHKDTGALSCRLELPSGGLDLDARRAMPTPWNAISHFLYLDRIFKKNRLFDRYWYGYVPEDKIQEVDVIQGAYFLAPKEILDKVGWYDEDYFLDGEDIDLCWKIKNLGYKIIYDPEVSIIHLKGSSKGKKKTSTVRYKDRIKYVTNGVRSMKIFYRKRLWNGTNIFFNYLVFFAIDILVFFRVLKISLKYSADYVKNIFA